jgi:hypothetical protein
MKQMKRWRERTHPERHTKQTRGKRNNGTREAKSSPFAVCLCVCVCVCVFAVFIVLSVFCFLFLSFVCLFTWKLIKKEDMETHMRAAALAPFYSSLSLAIYHIINVNNCGNTHTHTQTHIEINYVASCLAIALHRFSREENAFHSHTHIHKHTHFVTYLCYL